MTPGRLSRQISVGIHGPTVSATGLEGAATSTAFFRECEALGFDALWTEDQILHPAPIADPLLTLTWAAAHTERLLLGTAVVVLNLSQASLRPARARPFITSVAAVSAAFDMLYRVLEETILDVADRPH